LALFADIPERESPRRRVPVGWIVVMILVVIVGIAAFAPSPYVVEKPGPVYNTLGSVSVDDSDVPLIDIADEKTYPTDGSLDMLTVTIAGSRDRPESWLDVALASIAPSQAVLDVDDVYPEGETVEQSNEEGQQEMETSQKEAVAAALRHLDYSFSSTLSVTGVVDGTPADGVLEAGDVIRTFDGTEVSDVSTLRTLIADHGTSSPASIGIERGGAASEVQVTPADNNGTAVIGVELSSDYDFPFDVKIQLENVGGPSAGQMFALGIIDKLTPGALTGGADVAGTGTISASGDIGAIGGIRQKLYGAKDAGADYFLAPTTNCDEVTGHVPSGLTVFAVATLDDSLTALETVASGGDTSALPTCPAG
jgi:PDZ domain-containing protein